MATARKVNFRFGDVVQLEESSGHKASYRVQLVGVLPGLSLLVTAPDVRGAHVPLADGQIFEVRIFNGDDALAFSSMVIRSCQEPYPYVHLSYPERIEHVLVRNARRTRLKLPAQVNPLRTTPSDDPLSLSDRLGPSFPGVIRDLSTAGAQLETGSDLGPIGTRVVVTTMLTFDRVSGRSVVLPAEIRNVRELMSDDGSVLHYYGVQFIDLAVEADLALSAFVYRHLASQLLSDPIE